jgi:hypothetical protein
MVTFTKGPWQSMAKGGKYAVETVENYGGADSDRSVLVADCDTSDAIHAREKEANCRLIAAAPDLFVNVTMLLSGSCIETRQTTVGTIHRITWPCQQWFAVLHWSVRGGHSTVFCR